MATGLTERDRAKANRQASLLREAARLFAEHGFNGVSLEDLGAAVGVSGPAIYRHFANKQAVLGAILTGVSRRLHDGGLGVVGEVCSP
ncbi:MAG: helix-turn-helix domain-containing protein, partial [Microbacterium sp.]